MADKISSIKNKGLSYLGDLSKLKQSDFELAASIFSKVKGPELVMAVASSVSKVGAIIKIVSILGPVVIGAYEYSSKKARDYLDNKKKELKEIEEKCKDPNITEEEKDMLANKSADIVIGLQNINAFKKWAKVAGVVFLVPFPFNVIYSINKKNRKKKLIAQNNNSEEA